LSFIRKKTKLETRATTETNETQKVALLVKLLLDKITHKKYKKNGTKKYKR